MATIRDIAKKAGVSPGAVSTTLHFMSQPKHEKKC